VSIQPLDENRRRQIIIDFISTHQGCTAEDIVKGQNKIGRKKVFKIL
jgi:Tfp pilus assembly ATPase PilU